MEAAPSSNGLFSRCPKNTPASANPSPSRAAPFSSTEAKAAGSLLVRSCCHTDSPASLPAASARSDSTAATPSNTMDTPSTT